jgi:hypothetical protein
MGKRTICNQCYKPIWSTMEEALELKLIQSEYDPWPRHFCDWRCALKYIKYAVTCDPSLERDHAGWWLLGSGKNKEPKMPDWAAS